MIKNFLKPGKRREFHELALATLLMILLFVSFI